MERTLGERLGELRKSRGFTQNQVAEWLEVTAAAVSSYERDANQPSLVVLKRLAGLYHVSADYLLGLEESPCAELLRRQEELVLRLQGVTEEFARLSAEYSGAPGPRG
ncbi:MAG TPA: helix-turn-helix domain-containing protein [Firmicutes bacterium]|nr:helix-turn-helix domain-containing protein [Bacillota bacterium]